MSGFAPRIVGRLARICSAYVALFESFGLPQKSDYNATKARKCRQTVDELTCSKSMVTGIPHLPGGATRQELATAAGAGDVKLTEPKLLVSYAWLSGLPIHVPQGDLIGKRLNNGFRMYYEEYPPQN